MTNLGISMYRKIHRYWNYRYTIITLSSAYTSLKSQISCINILFILKFVKICTRENKDTTFDHKIAKFDTRENFRLYGTCHSRTMKNQCWNVIQRKIFLSKLKRSSRNIKFTVYIWSAKSWLGKPHRGFRLQIKTLTRSSLDPSAMWW